MSTISEDFKKVLKTYQSCLTLEQVVTTMKLAALFEYKWIDDEYFMGFMLEIYEMHNKTVDRLELMNIYVKDYKSQVN